MAITVSAAPGTGESPGAVVRDLIAVLKSAISSLEVREVQLTAALERFDGLVAVVDRHTAMLEGVEERVIKAAARREAIRTELFDELASTRGAVAAAASTATSDRVIVADLVRDVTRRLMTVADELGDIRSVAENIELAVTAEASNRGAGLTDQLLEIQAQLEQLPTLSADLAATHAAVERLGKVLAG